MTTQSNWLNCFKYNGHLRFFVIIIFELVLALGQHPNLIITECSESMRPFDLHKARKMKQKFLWCLVLIEQKVLQGIEFLARLDKISQELPCVKILARKILWKTNSPYYFPHIHFFADYKPTRISREQRIRIKRGRQPGATRTACVISLGPSSCTVILLHCQQSSMTTCTVLFCKHNSN